MPWLQQSQRDFWTLHEYIPAYTWNENDLKAVFLGTKRYKSKKHPAQLQYQIA